MTNINQLIFPPAILAAIISFLVTPFVLLLSWKVGLIDDPAKHKHPKVLHTYPIPRGGGLAIFTAFLLATAVFLPIDKHLLGIIAGAVVIMIMGILDDKFDLNPYLRLVIQFIAALFPIAAGIGIAYITNPFGGIIDLSHPQITFQIFGSFHSIWILSDLFALFLIVLLMNALNFGAKGVDGQLTGVVAIAAFVIAILSLRFAPDPTQKPVIILAAATGGAFLGFLPWHIYPQKIMPSFAGSNLAGYLLAILAILATAKVGLLLVALAVPLIDTGYVIVRRIASGKSPFWGDRGHLHHRLLDLGLTKPQVALLYWAITALLGILALNLNTDFKLYTMIGVGFTIGGLILWLTYRPK
ncbi:MAG TPA: MraY family glycosyltransferase [Patescibacteria group bacterium]